MRDLVILCVVRTPSGSKFATRCGHRNALCYKSGPMISFFIDFLTCLSALVRSRYNLGLEILALRQQLGVLKRKRPRPRLRIHDRIFWVLLRRLWPAWRDTLVIVKPETVVAWHRAGFRLFWRLDPDPRAWAGPRSMPRCELSSDEWRTRIPWTSPGCLPPSGIPPGNVLFSLP
jgi:hypothetical protein